MRAGHSGHVNGILLVPGEGIQNWAGCRFSSHHCSWNLSVPNVNARVLPSVGLDLSESCLVAYDFNLDYFCQLDFQRLWKDCWYWHHDALRRTFCINSALPDKRNLPRSRRSTENGESIFRCNNYVLSFSAHFRSKIKNCKKYCDE